MTALPLPPGLLRIFGRARIFVILVRAIESPPPAPVSARVTDHTTVQKYRNYAFLHGEPGGPEVQAWRKSQPNTPARSS